MPRRALSLLALVIASFVAACAEPTAPQLSTSAGVKAETNVADTTCRGGWIGSDGRTYCP